ncbi:MAG: hypothetical protein OXK79_01940 [Chloroflexota bacterium]|nr:hypothetical protein [Chloroflexota bacterium]
MAQQADDRRDDGVPHGVIDEMRRLREKSSPQFPYLDNDRTSKKFGELDKVRDWAKEMAKRGHVVSGIQPNCDDCGKRDDPPDVLAELDGRPIGVEVTDLLEYIGAQHERQSLFFSDDGTTTLTWRMRGDQVEFLCWDGAGLDEDERRRWEQRISENPHYYREAWATWSPERFRERLGEIVETKDLKMGAKRKRRLSEQGQNALEHSLSQSVLLVFTPERYLQTRLDEYLKGTTLVQPKNFDRVFVMGDEVRRGRLKSHPVFSVQLS